MRGFRITQISRGPKYHLHSVLCKLGQNKRHLDSGMSSASYGETFFSFFCRCTDGPSDDVSASWGLAALRFVVRALLQAGQGVCFQVEQPWETWKKDTVLWDGQCRTESPGSLAAHSGALGKEQPYPRDQKILSVPLQAAGLVSHKLEFPVAFIFCYWVVSAGETDEERASKKERDRERKSMQEGAEMIEGTSWWHLNLVPVFSEARVLLACRFHRSYPNPYNKFLFLCVS